MVCRGVWHECAQLYTCDRTIAVLSTPLRRSRGICAGGDDLEGAVYRLTSLRGGYYGSRSDAVGSIVHIVLPARSHRDYLAIDTDLYCDWSTADGIYDGCVFPIDSSRDVRSGYDRWCRNDSSLF